MLLEKVSLALFTSREARHRREYCDQAESQSEMRQYRVLSYR
jgi:hypothetical protein